jgi:hypothetical protein
VRVNAPTLSLTAADAAVAFGAATHVSGIVSTRRSGEHVTVLQRPYGDVDATPVAEVTTGEGGVYDVVVTPTIQTAYKATYRGVASAETTVAVRPTVKLTPGGRGAFLVRVGAGALLPGRSVSLQRRRTDGKWTDVARTRLGPALTATFRIPRVPGVVRYRAFMPPTSGYAESWSGTQTVRRR